MSADKPNKKHRIRFLPFEIDVEIAGGASILDAIRQADLPLDTTCGGTGTCGDCMVMILDGTYTAKPSTALSKEQVDKGYALACLTEVKDNLTVQLPQYEQLVIRGTVDTQSLQQNENISGLYEINPLVRRLDLEIPLPTKDDNYSDLKRLLRAIRNKAQIESLNCDYSVLKTLPHAVRAKHGQVKVVLLKDDEYWTVIGIDPADGRKSVYGIACDIGTTTVALDLVNLESGEILSTACNFNQQIKCGEDVISRINYSQKPGRLKELHDLVIKTINDLIEKVAETALISPSDIYLASISGNTTMIHLFLNLEPEYIRLEPYVPAVNELPILLSRDIGLNLNHAGRVYCSPLVGSYVGGDITAGVLCTPILKSADKISLFIDVGTNGEIVLGNQEWLMTCACSAGPAFEGSGTRCGMPAAPGAIESYAFKDDGVAVYEVINNCQPKGLCGSGLVDILAGLFINGYIDRSGKFNIDRPDNRIIEDEYGKGYLVESGENSYWGRNILLTENDISTLIFTKSAIFSACSLLLKNVGITFDEIDAVFIAGGFGKYLTIENAIFIGMLPDIDRDKFHYLGNCSLLGSYLNLISEKNRVIVNKITDKMTYIELNTEPSYMNEYTGALFLPHTNMDLFPSVKKRLSQPTSV